jgi:8-oxo-dGTP pyrophosphatase MutT (NUDIX family)
MHREPLLALLHDYLRRHPQEIATVQRVEELVRAHDDCFERTCRPGHVTASAWILSPDGRSFLLAHHRKLGRWLQLGGHVDGEGDVALAALREAREESGMQDFTFLPGPHVVLDVDVHAIPARRDESAHFHHDVRFLLVAAPGQELVVSDESHDLRWFAMDELESVAAEESLLRMGRKVRSLLG